MLSVTSKCHTVLRCVRTYPQNLGRAALLPVRKRTFVALVRAQPDDTNNQQHPELQEEVPTSGLVPDSLPVLSGNGDDWRDFRAKLVASQQKRVSQSSTANPSAWAHPIHKPERGSVLLAHPLMFVESQTYFFRSVILLLDHTPEGSHGVIVNKPSTYTIGDLSLQQQDKLISLDQFDNSRLYVGGDVGGGELILVHQVADLEGGVEVVKGVYAGGISSASKAVRDKRCTPSQFRWFTNYAGWGPGQLENEVKRGVWFTAACSPELLLNERDGRDVGIDLWYDILDKMGGDYAELSRTVREREDILNPKGSDAKTDPDTRS